MKTIFRPRMKSFDDRIRLRKSLSIEDAFTITVRSLNVQNFEGFDCVIIIKDAAKTAGLNRRSKEFHNEMIRIARSEYKNLHEVVAYSIAACSVGKGGKLEQEILKCIRKAIR